MKKDHCVIKETVDQGKRQFLAMFTAMIGGIGAMFAVIPFVGSWLPSAKAKASGAPIKVNIANLASGERIVVAWGGKPVWIVRRDQQTLERLTSDHEMVKLRDPDSKVNQQPVYARNIYRSIKPEYLVLVGICTHLGCSPNYVPEIGKLGPNWPGGFYCPCHGSKFDLAGRVFTGVPAPINLQVPPYQFVGDDAIVIGEDAGK